MAFGAIFIINAVIWVIIRRGGWLWAGPVRGLRNLKKGTGQVRQKGSGMPKEASGSDQGVESGKTLSGALGTTG